MPKGSTRRWSTRATWSDQSPPRPLLSRAVGVAIGTVVQSQPAAIAGSLAWLFIVEPTALLGLPSVGRWFPGVAGLALTESPNPDLLDQLPGGLLLAAWTVVALATALIRIRRTDV